MQPAVKEGLISFCTFFEAGLLDHANAVQGDDGGPELVQVGGQTLEVFIVQGHATLGVRLCDRDVSPVDPDPVTVLALGTIYRVGVVEHIGPPSVEVGQACPVNDLPEEVDPLRGAPVPLHPLVAGVHARGAGKACHCGPAVEDGQPLGGLVDAHGITAVRHLDEVVGDLPVRP